MENKLTQIKTTENIKINSKPKPECPFCKRTRDFLKGGLGMLRIGR